ncbi:hypothetical protein OZL92_22100 [Bacillus sonorensis]|uniref:Protein YebD n=2 Tax=Bacillus sonorensis TaxID=119858 RepID=M5P645_9BACI|nr:MULTISPECIES: hypothetical protein [Bacillus]TWK74655.1 hypothetical protein CHCC20335_3069 [Bacillus paralicheniformis]ASB87439.1 hypothetical protein S101395_00885 [Bacillus sonorensis]EME75471.1 protein YebD [Bacillus sonorensis L12]MCF7616901.1 hypothetical protein [Bacillus sonorensis]MCY7858571.1 hypothetical protein [Bacillus sonorensis]
MAKFLRKAIHQKKKWLIRQIMKSGLIENPNDLAAYTLSDLEKEHRSIKKLKTGKKQP